MPTSILLANVRMIMADARALADRHYFQTAQVVLASAFRYAQELQFCTDNESKAAVYAFIAFRTQLAQTVRFEMAAKKIEDQRGW